MSELFLRKGAERRLRAGHLWIFSNEVDTARNPLTQFRSGDCVQVRNAAGEALGSAYMEPNALICARLYAPQRECALDVAFFSAQLRTALQLRESFFQQPYYRLVYGDSDGLPGVVIDRFGEYLVLQLNNPGLERYLDVLLQSLEAVVSPAGVLLRTDSRSRREQGLAEDSAVVIGEVPEAVALVENGVKFTAPVRAGQKTGWFYDHRMNRARLRDWVVDKSVLDVYSYVGGWGVQAAVFGAREVCCVDSSAAALEQVADNAALNAVAAQVSCIGGSAPETMTRLREEGRTFDVVVLDPPAFIQRRKDLKKGITAYRRINDYALRLLNPGGLLVSASCSMQLPRADLIGAMQQAAVRAKCALQIVEQGGQGPDHPVHPAIPETEYLKAVFARKLPAA